MRPYKSRAKLIVAATGLIFLASPRWCAAASRIVHPFALKDCRGKTYSLDAIDGNKQAVAVVFLGAECPLSRIYAPRMEQLAREFAAKGVAFVAVDSNRQDGLTDLEAFARQHHLTFPILKDVGNKVADDFAATRTPEAFVLDAHNVIRYQGRIDDQYTFGAGVGYGKPRLKRADLAIAVDELLSGKAVSVPTTTAKGCRIGRVRQPQKNSTVTYSNQIAKLFNRRCVVCHRPGEIGPFPMTKYDEVAGWGPMIAEVVGEQRMPPWHANPAYGKFANEDVLSEKEKELISGWVDAGCPQGNPAEAPPPPKFVKGWLLERPPDKVLYMTEQPVEVEAEGVEPYQYYFVETGFEQDRWVKSVQCLPGNPLVVHHVVVYIVPRGRCSVDEVLKHSEQLCVFAPGTRPFIAPPGMAKLIPAHYRLMFQMHYTTVGSPQKDRTALGMLFEDTASVTHRVVTQETMNAGFEIPAGAKDYKIEAREKIGCDSLLISLYPHMHIRGRSFRFELVLPNGQKRTLLDVPHYDFNWQYWYQLAEPLRIPAGSEMRCTAHYDNSETNIFNPDPTKPVRYGAQTWEEMMIGWAELALPKAEAEKRLAEWHERQKREMTFIRTQPRLADSPAAQKPTAGGGSAWQLAGFCGLVAIASYALRRKFASLTRTALRRRTGRGDVGTLGSDQTSAPG